MKKLDFNRCSLSMTDHAETRAGQRSFRNDDLRLLADFADTVTDVGGDGTTAVSFSRKALEEVDPEIRALAERVRHKSLIINGETLITAVNIDNAKEEKRLRKGRHKNGHPHRIRKNRKGLTHG